MILEKKVAICIPYYKKAELLKRLLDSIQKQTFKEYAVFVVDDSDDEEVRRLINGMGENFIYHSNKERLGSTANCNKAMKLAQKCKPQYIKVMHHDDYFLHTYSLEKMVKIMDENPEAVIGFSNHSSDYGTEICDTCMDAEALKNLNTDIYSLLSVNYIGSPSTTIVKNLGIMMDEYLIWTVDIDWYVKFLEYKKNFIFTEEILIREGIDGKRVSDLCENDLQLNMKEWLYLYSKHMQIGVSPFIEKTIHQCISYYYKQKGYWVKNIYLAIFRDALNDGKKICLWCPDAESLEEGSMVFNRQKIDIDYFYLGSIEDGNYAKKKGCICLSYVEMMEKRNEIICIIMLKNAKEVRMKLVKDGICALPYMPKFLESEIIYK